MKSILSFIKQLFVNVQLRRNFEGNQNLLKSVLRLDCALHEKNTIIRFISNSVERGCTFDLHEGVISFEKHGTILSADIFDTSFLTVLDETDSDEYELNNIDLKGKIVLDIGANLGFISQKLLKKGAGYAILVEPNYKLTPYIHQNLSGNGYSNYEIVNVGLGSAVETVEIAYRPWASAGTKLDVSPPDIKPQSWPRIELPITTFSAFYKEYLIQHDVDLIKMDCEGGEYAIVADPLFEKCNADYVLIEYHAGPEAISSRLGELGYDIKIKPKTSVLGLIIAKKK